MKKPQSLLPIVVALVLVVVAVFMLVVKPQRSKLGDQRSQLAEARSGLATTNAEIAALQTDTDDPELAALLVKIPPADDTPAFLNQVGASATAAGVRVTRVSFAPPARSTLDDGSEVSVSMAAAGPRAAVDLFLSSVAALPRLTIVRQANVRPGTTVEGAATPAAESYEVEIDLAIFSGVQLAVPA